MQRLTTATFNVLDTFAVDEIIDNKISAAIDQLYILTREFYNEINEMIGIRGKTERDALISLLKNRQFVERFLNVGYHGESRNIIIVDVKTNEFKCLTAVEYAAHLDRHFELVDAANDEYIDGVITLLNEEYKITKFSDIFIK